MRQSVEAAIDAAFRESPAGTVATEFEGSDPRNVAHEREHLQIHHQLDVLVKGIRNSDGRRRQLTGFAAGVALFDLLNPPFDLADVLEIFVNPAAIFLSEARLH